jgi:phenylpropionate dioxygenase-like ring-hydroxylating dioxygenase large terminal subunit
MLSKDQNDLITLTGPGTPGGELMRRYWQPVALADELVDDQPLPVTILGEELVLFRGPDGAPQLIGRYCPHRAVDLSYGRVEAGGLRCLYHGWVLNGQGRCIQQPGEPAGSTFKDKIRTTAYPCREAAGLILAYMGPLDSSGEAPRLPGLPFFNCRPEQVFTIKVHQACNYLQANEGNIDPQHLSFLHVVQSVQDQLIPAANDLVAADAAPAIDVEETPWGHRIFTTRTTGPDTKYVRISNFIMPNAAAFDGLPPIGSKADLGKTNLGYQVHYHVPIADDEHWKYTVIYRHDGALDKELMRTMFFGDLDENYYSPRRRENRFLQSRDEIRNRVTYAGFGKNFYDHDTFAVETQGRIMDRSNEHLGTTDRPVILMRRQLLKAIDDVRRGIDPMFVERRSNSDAAAELVVRSDTIPASMDVSSGWWRKTPLAAKQLVSEPAE